jgi:hypothetical protein
VKFEQRTYEKTPRGNEKTQPLGMSKQRCLFVTAIIVLLIIGQLSAMAALTQPWPFAHYPMFTDLKSEPSLSKPQLYGVLQEEPYQEIPLRGDYIQPFEIDRLQGAIMEINREPDLEKRQQLLNEVTRDSLTRYERLRQAGRHDGPPLQGIRLYQVQWQLDPRVENVDQPDHRELLAEYEQS